MGKPHFPVAVSPGAVCLDYHLDRAKEVVVVSPSSGAEPELAAMLTPLRTSFVPNHVLSVVREGEELEAHAQFVPLVSGRRARQGKVTAYVCVNRVCDFPTDDPQVFSQQIGEIARFE